MVAIYRLILCLVAPATNLASLVAGDGNATETCTNPYSRTSTVVSDMRKSQDASEIRFDITMSPQAYAALLQRPFLSGLTSFSGLLDAECVQLAMLLSWESCRVTGIVMEFLLEILYLGHESDIERCWAGIVDIATVKDRCVLHRICVKYVANVFCADERRSWKQLRRMYLYEVSMLRFGEIQICQVVAIH